MLAIFVLSNMTFNILAALRGANGDFLLNGHYQVSVFRQQISLQDTILEYSGSDHAVEKINGTGPTRCIFVLSSCVSTFFRVICCTL